MMKEPVHKFKKGDLIESSSTGARYIINGEFGHAKYGDDPWVCTYSVYTTRKNGLTADKRSRGRRRINETGMFLVKAAVQQ